MALNELRLALLCFAQRWTPGVLEASVLLVPSGDPTAPLFPTDPGTAPFAGADVGLQVAVVPGLDAMPSLTAATQPLALGPPAGAAALFAELRTRFSPTDQTSGPSFQIPSQGALRKALPDTYLAHLPPGGPTSPFVGSTDEYGCTVRAQVTTPPPATRPDPTWGEVLSHALRNPVLATALGLRYSFTVPTPSTDGGWLFVTLDPAAATGYGAAWAAAPDSVKVYATRLARLGAQPRPLFSAVLFPVANPAAPAPTPDESALDEAIIEAAAYDDGFAKIVHARQPESSDAHVGDGATDLNAASDIGIQIGWDDEQVLTWQNRQIEIAHQALNGLPVDLEAPLGVQGYRIDVREPAPGETPAQRNDGWTSLMLATGTPPPPLNALVGDFSGELVVEPTASAPVPAPPAAPRPDEFWLPLYFAQWRGTPIGVRDDTPHLLAGGVAAGLHPPAVPSAFVGGPTPALLYGHTYEVRVRLGDQTGGGPRVDDVPVNETVAERARVPFARYVSPNAFVVGVDAPATQLTLRRPVIGYPEALFTARYGTRPEVRDATRAAMLAQLGLAADGGPLPPGDRVPDGLTVGVPDPDVSAVEIRVEVRALAHDSGDDVSADGVFTTLYVTTRAIPPLADLPAGAVTPAEVATDTPIPPIPLDLLDSDDAFARKPPPAGPLPVPRSRDVRIVVTPIADGPPGYFGVVDPASQRPPTRGAPAHVGLRTAAATEASALFTDPLLRPDVQAFYFQRPPSGDPVAALMRELASALDLVADGLTLRAQPGQRVAFGAGAGLACTIGPDGGTITLAAAADALRRWTVGVRYDLARDWTWDGLADDQVVVSRGADPIGTITLPRVATAESLAATPDRGRTHLVFLDAIDPAVPDPADGYTDRPPYTFSARVPDDAGGVLPFSTGPVAVRLPVVVPPAGVPELVSAGYALSPYVAAADYSATTPRTRHLWVELAAAPASGDAVFARVLAYAPDPLLYVDPVVLRAEPPLEPSLRLDPELVRVITPGQPRDEDGHEAMTMLVPATDSATRFLLPLPDGLSADDPRLFGLWTYELRFGHLAPWSTAHARFGRPRRVTGVQHPAPAGTCAAAWRPFPPMGVPLGNDLVVSASYARPVLDGRQVGDGVPRSTLGFLLYAQVEQADRSGRRNVQVAHHGADFVVDQGRIDYGSTVFAEQEIQVSLSALGLPASAPLSVLAVEFFSPGGSVGAEYGQLANRSADEPVDRQQDNARLDPFGPDFFGTRRILRTSPLVHVAPVC